MGLGGFTRPHMLLCLLPHTHARSSPPHAPLNTPRVTPAAIPPTRPLYPHPHLHLHPRRHRCGRCSCWTCRGGRRARRAASTCAGTCRCEAAGGAQGVTGDRGAGHRGDGGSAGWGAGQGGRVWAAGHAAPPGLCGPCVVRRSGSLPGGQGGSARGHGRRPWVCMQKVAHALLPPTSSSSSPSSHRPPPLQATAGGTRRYLTYLKISAGALGGAALLAITGGGEGRGGLGGARRRGKWSERTKPKPKHSLPTQPPLPPRL